MHTLEHSAQVWKPLLQCRQSCAGLMGLTPTRSRLASLKNEESVHDGKNQSRGDSGTYWSCVQDDDDDRCRLCSMSLALARLCSHVVVMLRSKKTNDLRVSLRRKRKCRCHGRCFRVHNKVHNAQKRKARSIHFHMLPLPHHFKQTW